MIIAEQSACHGIFPELVDGWQPMPLCETDDPVAPYIEVWVGRDQQRPNLRFHQRRKCGIKLLVGAGFIDDDPLIDRARRLLDFLQLAPGWRKASTSR